MAKYIVNIKEVGNPSILHPSLDCDEKTKEEIIKFFGLKDADVEWYRIYKVVDGKEIEL